MNRGRGGGGGGRGGSRGGGGGGRHYFPRGRSPQSTAYYVARRTPVEPGAHLDDASSGSASSGSGRRNSGVAPIDGVIKKFDGILSSDYPHGPNSEPHGAGNLSPNDGSSKLVQNPAETEPKPLNVPSVGPCYDNDSPSLSSPTELNARASKIIQSPDQDVENHGPSYMSCTPAVDVTHSSQGTSGKDELENSDSQHNEFSFDICEERNKKVVKLKPALLHTNKAIRNETKRRMQGDNVQIFRPGMILLKGYISLMDQVKLIKSCRDLGRGPGGFYQPGYRDGARLHLKMMCLGKNWDPETSKYGEERPIDQAKPPPIPNEFQELVKEAIQECHHYLESDPKVRNARNVLPSMSPNICIINFYTKTGKLGLHQDKDESEESRRKGLPVVSISLGESAEFLYGDQRDIDKADKLVLESGDVLIFGGQSRHIFHGVSSIIPNTAPKALLDETDLKPGRVNLTFREY